MSQVQSDPDEVLGRRYPADIALITVGAGARVDTRTTKDPIVGFVFDVKGLMADISLKGAKFTKLDK